MAVREWVTARAVVVLVALAALLSVVVGIGNILTASITANGPLAPFLPRSVIRTAGFTGTLTGFLLLLAAAGLQRGLRTAWYAAVVLLPISAAQGLLQATNFALALVAASLFALIITLLNRAAFDSELDLTATQIASLAALIGAQAYGTAGGFALRDQFDGIDSLTDAVYFTLVTGSTVGYGDVTPMTSIARWFTMSALVLNVAAFAVALGVLFTPAIEARLSKALGRMTDTDLDLLDDHVLVLGYGDLTEPVLEELAPQVEFLVITPDEAVARRLREREIKVLTADPSDEEPLMRAGVERARAVVAATNNDAEDALSILTARQLNPEVNIVAAATARENVDKLKRAGANDVVSPASIGGHMLVESALADKESPDVADRLLTDEAVDEVSEAIEFGEDER